MIEKFLFSSKEAALDAFENGRKRLNARGEDQTMVDGVIEALKILDLSRCNRPPHHKGSFVVRVMLDRQRRLQHNGSRHCECFEVEEMFVIDEFVFTEGSP